MVCHQVVATLDVVISDLRRDKVNEMLPWVGAGFLVGQLGGPGEVDVRWLQTRPWQARKNKQEKQTRKVK